MHTIALLYTARSEAERDLGQMINHLTKALDGMEGVKVVREVLTGDKPVQYGSYHHLVFCGYDHITLGHIHLAMAVTDPAEARITLYDEPGAAIERELSAIVFRAIDLRRAPGSSATRLMSSWNHRDILAIAKQDVLKYSDGTDGSAGTVAGAIGSPARPGKPSRGARARKVDHTGAASAREGDAAARGEVGGGGDATDGGS